MREVNANNFEAEVIKSNIPVVVDFWASWCAPCLKLTPIVEDFAGQHLDKVKFVKLSIEEAPEVATKYMVMSIPTLMLFKDGVPCEKRSGLLSKSDLEKFVFSFL